MIKKVSGEEKKDQQNPERKESKSDVFFAYNLHQIPAFTFVKSISNYSIFSYGKELKMPRSVFRPPLV